MKINSVSISEDGSQCVFGASFECGNRIFYIFLYDNNNTQAWENEISDQVVYQGVFWLGIKNNGEHVTSGREFSDTQGFLTAYSAKIAHDLLNISTKNNESF